MSRGWEGIHSCRVWLYTVISLSKKRYHPLPPAGGPSTDYHKQYSEFCLRSNLPVVLLSMAGNHFEVSTAIFTEAVYADKLLSLDLSLGSHGPANVLRLGRVFMAIDKCIKELRELYGNVENLSGTLSSVLYPNPTEDPPTSTSKKIPKLEFFSKLDRVMGTPIGDTQAVESGNERHAIYLAKMLPPTEGALTGDVSTKDVLVKFTPGYNEAAHELLASQDPPLAPALHCCVRVVGDMYMVVMDYMSEAKALHLFFPPSPSPLPNPPTTESIHRDLTKALRVLHGNDYVFGDLRAMNILYSSKDDRTFLVDFDGVGKHKHDRYSPCLNTSLDLGVDKWQVMEKPQDLVNMEQVIKWLSKKLLSLSQ